MLNQFGISDDEWNQTPLSVRSLLLSLHQKMLLLEIRSQAYERQLESLRHQVAQIDDLKAELDELRERLGQNSSNSSMPPSNDPPHHTNTTPTQSKGRKRGGQVGHRGNSRKFKLISEVDRVIDLKPVSCADCGQLLLGEDASPARHQVSEIPHCKAEVIEYRRHTLRCLSCGAINRADWPDDMPAGSFGPRVQSVAAYLTGRLMLSHRDITEVMQLLFGMKVSLGTVSALQRKVSDSLRAVVEQAKQFVERQLSQNVDETSWAQAQKQKWLWVNATRDVTVYHLLEGRASKQAKQVISEQAKSIICTDRFGAYNWLEARRRQVCWAHLKRDFQAMVDRGGQSAEVGEGLLKQLEEIFTLWHQVRGGEMNRKQLQVEIGPVKKRVNGLLKQGRVCDHKKTRRVCERIEKLRRSLWRFIEVEGVEPTNNRAERALRRAVMWRRKSFGTQSESGSEFVERIMTAIMSLRQQGREVLENLTAICSGQSLSLLPDST